MIATKDKRHKIKVVVHLRYTSEYIINVAVAKLLVPN